MGVMRRNALFICGLPLLSLSVGLRKFFYEVTSSGKEECKCIAFDFFRLVPEENIETNILPFTSICQHVECFRILNCAILLNPHVCHLRRKE
uniref:Putative secreted protein n=1 Tax=Rhipicephalus microplus TaxID=6941 RepID=A0A6M2DDI5_RHIMP